MNIQQFSAFSLDDILIDPEQYSQHQIEGEESEREDYDEDFENESNLHLLSYNIQNKQENEEQNEENEENENEQTKEYENTFENSEIFHQSSSYNNRSLNRNCFDEESDNNRDEDNNDQYENTFENEYTTSIIDKLSPNKNNFDIKVMLSSPQSSEKQSPTTLGSISAIKSTENIKTLEDLEMMSSPSPSSSPSSSSSSSDTRQKNSNSHGNFDRDLLRKSSNLSQPLRTKTNFIPASSESNFYKESYIIGKATVSPKFFSRVQPVTVKDHKNIPGLKTNDSSKISSEKYSKITSSPNNVDQSKSNNQSSKNLENKFPKETNNFVEPWNITTEDLNTMKKAKVLLERIEYHEKLLQDQQTHKMVARKCVVIQNLDLGLKQSPSNNNPKFPRTQSNPSSVSSSISHEKESIQVHLTNSYEQNSLDIDNLRSDSNNFVSNGFGLNDDDGKYPNDMINKNYYGPNENNNHDDDNDDDEYSLASILSNSNEYNSNSNQLQSSYQSKRNTNSKNSSKKSFQREYKKSNNIEFETGNEFRSNKQLLNQKHSQENKKIVSSRKKEELEDLAEQTYFNFISDLSNISKSRSLNSSLEQLAMQRVISDRIYSYFTQPNFIKLIRNEMIEAAQDMLDSVE